MELLMCSKMLKQVSRERTAATRPKKNEKMKTHSQKVLASCQHQLLHLGTRVSTDTIRDERKMCCSAFVLQHRPVGVLLFQKAQFKAKHSEEPCETS